MPAIGSETRIALACVFFTLGAYLGLARNVRSPGPARSMAATERISISGSPSMRQPSAWAISRSVMAILRLTRGGWLQGRVRVTRLHLQERAAGGQSYSNAV